MQCHKRRGSLSVCIKDETEKMALGSEGERARERESRRTGWRMCVKPVPLSTMHTHTHTYRVSEHSTARQRDSLVTNRLPSVPVSQVQCSTCSATYAQPAGSDERRVEHLPTPKWMCLWSTYQELSSRRANNS